MPHYIKSASTGDYYIYDDYNSTVSWNVCNDSTKELVQGEITVKQKKMIKEEIKVWMDDHLQKTIQKESGKLLQNIKKLKEEKTKLGQDISTLKHDLKKTKKEIREEIKAMEEIISQHYEKTMRFYNMDL